MTDEYNTGARGRASYWMDRAQRAEAENARLRAVVNRVHIMEKALRNLVGLIEGDGLLPESVPCMRDAREALATPPPESEPELARRGEDAREDAWLVGRGSIPAWASSTEREKDRHKDEAAVDRFAMKSVSYSCLGCGQENIPKEDLNGERHAKLMPDGDVDFCGPIVIITEPADDALHTPEQIELAREVVAAKERGDLETDDVEAWARRLGRDMGDPRQPEYGTVIHNPEQTEGEPMSEHEKRRNRRINKLMGDLWDVVENDDPEQPIKSNAAWDLLDRFDREVREDAVEPQQAGDALAAYAVVSNGEVKGLWTVRDWDHAGMFAERHGWSVVPLFFGEQRKALAASSAQEGRNEDALAMLDRLEIEHYIGTADENERDLRAFRDFVAIRRRLIASGVPEDRVPHKCPSCGSPSPERHPAVQFEGEVMTCHDPWHQRHPADLGQQTAESVLRSLASWLGVGGYNADRVDPATFEAKIREGVELAIRVEKQRASGVPPEGKSFAPWSPQPRSVEVSMSDDMKIGRARFDAYPPEAGQDSDTIRGNEAALREADTRCLNNRLAQAEALLRELAEYFDNYADVTDSDRGVAEVPNEAMEWKLRIDSCLSGD